MVEHRGREGQSRLIDAAERFGGPPVSLRLADLADCTERYVAWLMDPAVNQFLETRWTRQTLQTIREFVGGMVVSADSYLFAIVETDSGEHIGNLKIGPIHARHFYADLSYFIGERSRWGFGYATAAIRCATRIGFERLGLHRLQAGLYASNGASGRALEKAGYSCEGRFKAQLRTTDGWEDHVWYGITREDWLRQNQTEATGKAASVRLAHRD
jgi:RimJ/RimL family protein N-acetyltransferase